MSQILGYTGPVSAGAAPRPPAEGLPARRPHRQGRASRRRTSRPCAAPTAPRRVERDARGRKIQVLADRSARPSPGNSLDADDRHQGAEGRREGAQVGHAGGRPQARRGHRHEPADRRGRSRSSACPTYDNNLFARGISNTDYQKLVKNPDKPLLNHAIQAHYPPGSTYKLVAGHRRPRRRQDHAPTTRIHDQGLPDARRDQVLRLEPRGFGPLQHLLRLRPLERHVLLTRSAGMLGIDRLGYWAKQYGFGSPTGIDLPGEVVGHRPDQPVEAGHARRADLPRRDLPGGHRPGLRRRDADPADQRLRRARERRQALPAAGRPRDRRPGRRRSSDRSSPS